VKVLILSESRATLKDFYLISAFTKLIKIDLSYNKLTAFPPGFSFKAFSQLRTLFLHYNKFTSIKLLLPVIEVQPS
jgi:Leucine-rich repeat (LRR) protein